MRVMEKNNWSIEERCTGKGNGDGGCNSLLLIEKEDLYFCGEIYSACGTQYGFAFKCPVCNLWTDVDNIPYNIKKELLFDKYGAYKPNIRKKVR